ncbi:DUF3265 domain-containing protein (plasmid) [Vibrio campbellii]|nr:DUF3265 domain-containing protein [Vibrio campbellii]
MIRHAWHFYYALVCGGLGIACLTP